MNRIAVFTLVTIAVGILHFSAAARSDNGTRRFTVGGGGSLEVSIGSGDIHITTWNKNEVSVTVRDLDEENNLPEMTQSGSTVRIESSRDADFSLEVIVPVQFNIMLRCARGDINVQGPLTGTISGVTGGGEVRLGDIGGKILMKTSGGDVTTGNIQGDVELNTSGGNIQMGSVSGEADITTSGGEIDVDGVGRGIRARTSGGNVTIGNVGGDAMLETAGGNIEAGNVAGSASLSTAGGNVVLRGATGKISAATAGGNLRLEKISGTVDARTAGGDIVVSLSPAKTGMSTLSSAGGDILLLIPENAHATITARIHIEREWMRNGRGRDIGSDFKIGDYEKDRDEIRGTVSLNGGGEPITLETVNGAIEIRKAK